MDAVGNLISTLRTPYMNSFTAASVRSSSPESAVGDGDKTTLKCPLCQEMLLSQKEFTVHIRAHNEVKPTTDPNDPSGQTKVYFCCLCGKMLSSFSSLDRHMLVHSGERPFSCEQCGQTFTTNGNMHRHKRTHGSKEHELETPRVSRGGRKRKQSLEKHFPDWAKKKSGVLSEEKGCYLNCTLCTHKSFASDVSLEEHYHFEHRGESIPCDECSHTFPAYNYYKLHKSICHHKSLFSLTTTMAQNTNFISVGPEESVIKAESSSILDLSSSPIKSEKPESESDVYEQFVDDTDHIIREMKMKGEFPCRLCSAVYPNLRALKGHNKEHLHRAPYICNVGACVYSSSDKSTLARHMRSHTGEKPFECKVCNFGFTTKANCERHVKNKHAKCSREELRDSIVIHEASEDNEGGGEKMSWEPSTPVKVENDKKPCSSVLFAPYRPTLYRSPNEEEEEEEEDVKEEKEYCINNGGSSSPPTEVPLDLSSHRSTGYEILESENSKNHQSAAFLFTRFAAAAAAAAAAVTTPLDLTSYILAQQEILRRQREAAAVVAASADPANILRHFNSLHLPQSEETDDTKTDDVTSGDYKMVIKNGVLMKKQKQRRYRTERPYACEHCNAKFTLRSNMERHIKQQHSKKETPEELTEESPVKNEEDGIGSSESEDSDLHKKTTSLSHKVTCPYCSRRFPWNSSSLHRHILTHTGNNNKPHQCSECFLWFTSKINCDRHLLRKHGNNNNNNNHHHHNLHFSQSSTKCTLCPYLTFSNSLDLKKHQYKTHLNHDIYEIDEIKNEKETQEQEDEEEEGLLSKRSSDSSYFKCHLCDDVDDEVFYARNDAIIHLQEAHKEEYKELRDKGAFNSETNFETLNHNNDEEEENDVRKSSDYNNSRKVICIFCNKKFWSAEDLRRHVRTHTGERPYTCDLCQRRFTLKHSMLRHRKKHDSGVSSDSESDRSSFSDRLSPTSSVTNVHVKKRANLMDTINKLSAFHQHSEENR